MVVVGAWGSREAVLLRTMAVVSGASLEVVLLRTVVVVGAWCFSRGSPSAYGGSGASREVVLLRTVVVVLLER